MSKWINVNERLPKLDEYVLVFYKIEKHKYIEIARVESITTNSGGSWPSWVDKDYDTIKPTHWMSLPKTPNDIHTK